MEVTKRLSEFVVNTSYKDIPEDIRETSKRIFLDSLGCALGGASLPSGKIVIETVKEMGGVPESTVIGGELKISPMNAAYANCKLSNLMDMDDVFWNSAHFSPIVIYPALAIAEKEDSSGQEFVTALTLGLEVAARIAIAIGPLFDIIDGRVEYVSKGACGFGQHIFGGVAAASRLLGFDTKEIRQAMGIGGFYAPCAISPKTTNDLTMSKYALEWSAAGAVMANGLVRNGFEGPENILDDDLFAKAMGKHHYDPSPILKNLGTIWYGTTTSLKLYPSCRYNHHALDLLKEIIENNGLQPGEIEEVKVNGLGRLTMWPWTNQEPGNEFWGEFSLPYNLALIAFGIPSGPEWMNPVYLRDQKILDFCRKVEITTHPAMEDVLNQGFPAALQKRPTEVTVFARGRTFKQYAETARGDGWSKEAALSDSELEDKFSVNASPLLPKEKIRRIVQLCLHLDKVSNLRELCELLIGRDLGRSRPCYPILE